MVIRGFDPFPIWAIWIGEYTSMKSSYLMEYLGWVLSWRTRVKPAWFTALAATDPSGAEAVSRLWRGHGRIETQRNPPASRPLWAMVMWTKGLERQICLWINFDVPQKLLLLKFCRTGVVASEGHEVFEFDRCPCQFQYSSVNRLAWKIQGTSWGTQGYTTCMYSCQLQAFRWVHRDFQEAISIDRWPLFLSQHGLKIS